MLLQERHNCKNRTKPKKYNKKKALSNTIQICKTFRGIPNTRPKRTHQTRNNTTFQDSTTKVRHLSSQKTESLMNANVCRDTKVCLGLPTASFCLPRLTEIAQGIKSSNSVSISLAPKLVFQNEIRVIIQMLTSTRVYQTDWAVSR